MEETLLWRGQNYRKPEKFRISNITTVIEELHFSLRPDKVCFNYYQK